jgi:hypothetical protein
MRSQRADESVTITIEKSAQAHVTHQQLQSDSPMISRPRLTKNTIIFGGVATWGLLLVSCVMVDRAVIMPPNVPGAKFVGSKECVECHEAITTGFHDATHAKLMAPGDNAKNIGCESCHGPGSVHSRKGSGHTNIVNPARNPDACFQCHLDKRGEFALPHAHPAGKVTCSDCHDLHKGDAIMTGGTKLAGANETCLKCHSAQRSVCFRARSAA